MFDREQILKVKDKICKLNRRRISGALTTYETYSLIMKGLKLSETALHYLDKCDTLTAKVEQLKAEVNLLKGKARGER